MKPKKTDQLRRHGVRLLPLLVLLLSWLAGGAAAAWGAHTKQEVINTLTKAGHAYWKQRVVIEHPQRTYYGYSGRQTVIDPQNPTNRFYFSDGGFLHDPHIFVEHEDTTGYSGVCYAYVKAYQATSNKFFLRVAKELGYTMLSAQRDNGTGGWWQDMTVAGVDKRKGSPTYGKEVNFGRWVNATPFSRRANVSLLEQNLTSLDGCSFIPALALLRLSQALPPGDPDKTNFLAGAKWFADTIAELPQYRSTVFGYYPYKNGGTPQWLPFDKFYQQHMATYNEPGPGYANDLYPYAVPFGTMITLNDKAMIYTMNFMMEFLREATNNSSLPAAKYYNAVLTNVLYLLAVHEKSRNPDGRGGFAMQYHIEDGTNGGKIAWGRRYEPPGFSPHAEAENVLMAWLLWETNQTVRGRIENALLSWALYWKYNALPFNHPSIRHYATNSPAWSASFTNYSEGNILTYQFWTFYNHTASAERVNTVTRYSPAISGIDAFVSGTRRSEPWYCYTYGTNAMFPPENSAFLYGMTRRECAKKINTILRDNGPTPYVELWRRDGSTYDRDLTNWFGVDADQTVFNLNAKGSGAMHEVDPETGFVLPAKEIIYGQEFITVSDKAFCSRVAALATYAQSVEGAVVDSDGDGICDDEEVRTGTDPFDSESRKPLNRLFSPPEHEKPWPDVSWPRKPSLKPIK